MILLDLILCDVVGCEMRGQDSSLVQPLQDKFHSTARSSTTRQKYLVSPLLGDSTVVVVIVVVVVADSQLEHTFLLYPHCQNYPMCAMPTS